MACASWGTPACAGWADRWTGEVGAGPGLCLRTGGTLLAGGLGRLRRRRGRAGRCLGRRLAGPRRLALLLAGGRGGPALLIAGLALGLLRLGLGGLLTCHAVLARPL